MHNTPNTCNSQLVTRNYPRGNIILMVLFILVTSSAFALLMMQYTRTMFDQTMTTHSYNRAYYLANAGLEVGLADSLGRVGYQKDFTDSEALGCADGACAATGSIVARDTFHTNQSESTTECTEDNAFSLKPGDSLAFPLFWEGGGVQNNTTIVIIGANNRSAPTLAAGATVQDGDSFASVINDNPGPSFSLANLSQKINGNPGEYLVLINKDSSIAQFCVTSSAPIPRAILRIDGQGQFRDYSINLSAVKKVSLPGFLFSTSVGR